jgi:hypothetical protein
MKKTYWTKTDWMKMSDWSQSKKSVQHEGSLAAAICSTMYPETRSHQ